MPGTLEAYNIRLLHDQSKRTIAISRNGPITVRKLMDNRIMGEVHTSCEYDFLDKSTSLVIDVWCQEEDIPEMEERLLKVLKTHLELRRQQIDGTLEKIDASSAADFVTPRDSSKLVPSEPL